MAHQLIFKDLGVENEGSFGASTAGTADRLAIKDSTLGQDPGKVLVESTPNNPKGNDRMVRTKNTIEGDITMEATPRTLHYAIEWANGRLGTSVAHGATAAIITYKQNDDGVMATKTVVQDRQNSQTKFYQNVG